jgi:hypothetical protein
MRAFALLVNEASVRPVSVRRLGRYLAHAFM